jgi:FkbM family methyltransferase
MSNKKNTEDILAIIGQNKELRDSFVEWCKLVESKFNFNGSIRDEYTKFLVDAIYKNVYLERKSIANGLTYDFMPNIGSKVAREFIMSEPKVPNHVWEPQTSKILVYLAGKTKRDVMIGGAYFGDQAIEIAKTIQGHAKVHAFDLNERQIEILNSNARLNGLDNITVTNKGLWNNSNTYLNLSEGDDLAFATPIDANLGKASNTITVDEYLDQHKVANIGLIMLDIEGSEYNVFLGSEHQLKKDVANAPNIVFEVHSLYVDWTKGLHNTEIVKYLESFGYTVYSFRDFQANYDMTNKKIELIKPSETYLEGPHHGFNMVAIKDATLIDESLFKLVKNVSPKYLVHKDPALHHHTEGFK